MTATAINPASDETLVIEVRNLVKEYRLGAIDGLRTLGRRMLGRPVEERQRFRALDDVSFSVKRGEVVGIIGHNGAGKSTLLKHLCGITTPTTGSVRVRGRVAPLIEVGSGLVGDLTGRENIYLNAAILGLTRKAVHDIFDEVVDFAELSEFIDTPVKRYSSGMQIRLGYAIATAVASDLLIVDEVLAVGDLAFQRKCFDRMESIIRRRGATVLLVSHNIRQIDRLCNRALLLDHGRLIEDGPPSQVCGRFYTQSNTKILQDARNAKANINTTGEVELIDITVLGDDNHPTDSILSCAPLRISVKFLLDNALEDAEIIVGTHSTDFVYLTASSTKNDTTRLRLPAGEHEIVYEIDSFPLKPGSYCVRFSIYDAGSRPVFIGETLRTFGVSPATNEAHEAGSRILHIPATWRLDGAPWL